MSRRTAKIIEFPGMIIRNPRCATCRHWTPQDGRSPLGFCEKKEEQTNSDYRCDEHRAVE